MGHFLELLEVNPRKLAAFIVVLTVALIAALVLLVMLFSTTRLRIVNDTNYEIGLRGCTEWKESEPGFYTEFGPVRPCYVYRVEGNRLFYLGCLYFPDEVWEVTGEIRVSKLDANVTHEECERSGTYYQKGRLRKTLNQVARWLPP